MVRDAVRGYWALASGLTDITRQKATAAARALVSQGEATAEQAGAIAEDLISTSMSNRAALVNIVRFEVDRARSAIGMPTSSDLEALTRRIGALESQLAALRGAVAADGPPAPTKAAAPRKAGTSARKAAAPRTARTAAKKSATQITAVKKSATKKPATKKTAAKKTAATKTAATKVAKKAARTPARSAAQTSGGSRS